MYVGIPEKNIQCTLYSAKASLSMNASRLSFFVCCFHFHFHFFSVLNKKQTHYHIQRIRNTTTKLTTHEKEIRQFYLICWQYFHNLNIFFYAIIVPFCCHNLKMACWFIVLPKEFVYCMSSDSNSFNNNSNSPKKMRMTKNENAALSKKSTWKRMTIENKDVSSFFSYNWSFQQAKSSAFCFVEWK